MKTLNDKISEHPLCAGMKADHLRVLAEGAVEMRFKPGQVILREGEPASQFYLIESGRVAIEAHQPGDGTAPVQWIEAGDALGWSWMFPPFSWHFQARAVEPTQTLMLNGAHLLVTAERDHDFGYELMKRVAQVAIRRLQASRRRLLEREIESAMDG